MNILLLCGSAAQHSRTHALLTHIGNSLQAKTCVVEMWDLSEKPLPFALPQYHKDPLQHPDAFVRAFAEKIQAADAIILGSPLYHGSYTGVLKNALDNIAGNAFAGKWAALVGNAGSIRASHVQFSHLRQVVNTMGGYTAQTQIGTCGEDYTKTAEGFVLNDESMKQRCERLVTELVKNISL